MTHLLDTTVCIALLRGTPDLRQRFLQMDLRDLAMCSVVREELVFGALRRKDGGRSLDETHGFLDRFASLPFDDRAADVCARLRTELATQGNPIGPHDMQIAAIALAHGLTVVTHNTREFARVRGLQIEDWEA